MRVHSIYINKNNINNVTKNNIESQLIIKLKML